jgi:hypothetical protein
MVKCEICKRLYNQITNTHLSIHNTTTEQYKAMFPNSPTISESLSKTKSECMIGKNKGNERKDARERMNINNPMKDKSICIKMGNSRSKGISEGRIKALDNLGHLPTDNEKKLIQIFEDWEIPLEYVGDGKKWIENHCPDFINEELKIIVELDLDCFSQEEDRKKLEQIYWRNGYRLIWLTTTDEQEVEDWLFPFFNQHTWHTIYDLQKVKNTGRMNVYNFECTPNNNYFADDFLVHNCFADSFRSSLYTSFFDNGKTMGLRHCKPDFFKVELDKLMKHRGKRNDGSEVQRAIGLQIPIRLGIRFEDFLPIEKRMGISLQFLQYLKEIAYPVMINTKSDLIGHDEYVRALADNKGGAAVHITMISSDDILNKKIEPGAPIFRERIKAAQALTKAGVRVVARIEPFMVFLTDEDSKVKEWVDAIIESKIEHITLDTYSYSALSPGIRRQMEVEGIDFERMFLLMSDAQWLGSLLLGTFIKHLEDLKLFLTGNAFHCSTFDFGNVPHNNQDICCEVGDLFIKRGAGFSYGNNLMAIRYIKESSGKPTTWDQYNSYVEEKGGWLSESIKRDVFMSWNMAGGNPSYYPDWAQGTEPHGLDGKGCRIWRYNRHYDFRLDMLKSIIGG